MDTFVEQIVKKKYDSTDILVIVAAAIGGLAVLGAVALFFGYVVYLFAFILVGIGYLMWWLITSRNKEYEYCVTNGDVDIDCIISKRKRERIVSVRGAKIESFVPYTRDLSARPFDRKVMAAPSPDEATWCFTYHSKKKGHTLVMMAPNERVWQALYDGLQKTVQLETDRKQKGL